MHCNGRMEPRPPEVHAWSSRTLFSYLLLLLLLSYFYPSLSFLNTDLNFTKYMLLLQYWEHAKLQLKLFEMHRILLNVIKYRLCHGTIYLKKRSFGNSYYYGYSARFQAIALFTLLSPMTPMCVPVYLNEQFVRILPQIAFSFVPWFYSWPSFSENPFEFVLEFWCT